MAPPLPRRQRRSGSRLLICQLTDRLAGACRGAVSEQWPILGRWIGSPAGPLCSAGCRVCGIPLHRRGAPRRHDGATVAVGHCGSRTRLTGGGRRRRAADLVGRMQLDVGERIEQCRRVHAERRIAGCSVCTRFIDGAAGRACAGARARRPRAGRPPGSVRQRSAADVRDVEHRGRELTWSVDGGEGLPGRVETDGLQPTQLVAGLLDECRQVGGRQLRAASRKLGNVDDLYRASCHLANAAPRSVGADDGLQVPLRNAADIEARLRSGGRGLARRRPPAQR